MTDEKVIDTIRKLLRLTESSNEHEAALAASRAAEIAAKYGIDIAQASMAEDRPVGADRDRWDGRIDPWRRMLAQAVAHSLGGRIVWGTESGRHSLGYIWFFGPEDTSALMRGMYESLEASLTDMSAFAMANRPNRSVNGLRYRVSWLSGATDTIVHRLAQRKREFDSVDSNRQALVLISRAVDQLIKEQFPRTESRSVRQSLDPDAYRKGRADGRGVSFGDRQFSHRKELAR